ERDLLVGEVRDARRLARDPAPARDAVDVDAGRFRAAAAREVEAHLAPLDPRARLLEAGGRRARDHGRRVVGRRARPLRPALGPAVADRDLLDVRAGRAHAVVEDALDPVGVDPGRRLRDGVRLARRLADLVDV